MAELIKRKSIFDGQFIAKGSDVLEIDCEPCGLPTARIVLRENNFDRRNGTFKYGAIENLPKKYIVNEGATVLFWTDKDKTIVKRSSEDTFDPVKGFLWAYFQKTSGMSRTKANRYLKKVQDEYEIKKAKKQNVQENTGDKDVIKSKVARKRKG